MVNGLLPVQALLNPAGGVVVGGGGRDQIRDKCGSLEARKCGSVERGALTFNL